MEQKDLKINKIFKIFLASSEELKDDRVAFGDFIGSLNDIYIPRGIWVQLFKWENYDAAYNDVRKQDEYNDNVEESVMFLSLFYTKGGKYTIEEFDVARKAYRENKLPKVYVYCKKLQTGKRGTKNLREFKEKLKKELDYYWVEYQNLDQLQLHFIRQFLQVENTLRNLEEKDGNVMLEGKKVANIDNLPFAKNNEDYQRISAELLSLPEEIAVARKLADEHPDNSHLRSKWQEKVDCYNQLKEEIAGLQKTFFEMSQISARIQQEQLGGKLQEATKTAESGNREKANSLLNEVVSEAESVVGGLKKIHEPVHQGIYALLLQAKTVMAELNTPIKERISQVQAIYAKADLWAKESALPDEKYEGLLRDYAKFLKDYGLYKEAEPVYRRLIDLHEKLYGKEHAGTAASYNNIGLLYKNQGDYAKALEYYRKALNIFERVLSPEHPNTAVSYNNIGAVYDDQGDYTKALEYYKKALDIRERVLGPDHPDTAQSYNNIGAVYYEQSDYAKALEYYRKDLDICERVLGPDHPDTATSYNNIGEVYRSQGGYAKALEYYRKDLAMCERVLGPNHPNTATSYNNIGLVYYEQGDHAKALEYYGKALDIIERVLGSDHPHTATSYNNIGMVYDEQGDYAKALEYYGKALNIREQVLGSDHPNTATSYNNIGSMYYKQEKYPEALEYLEKALEIRKAKLGEDHPKTKNTQGWIDRSKAAMEE